MRKALLFFFLTLLSATLVSAQTRRVAYVVNGTAETLSMIDLESGSVENDVVVLGNIPGELAMWDDRLYVVNSGDNNLQVIDPESRTTVATIELGPDNNPFDIEIAPAGTAYVSNFVSNRVFVVDLVAQAVVDTIAVGKSPEGVLLVGNKLFVCNTAFDPVTFGYGPGTVMVVDVGTNTVVDTIAVGTNPQHLALGADSLVHVVATGNFADISGAVYVIDPGTHAVMDTIEVGGQPGAIAVSPDGIAYLAAGGWVDKGFVYSYDTRTHEVLHGEANPMEAPTGVLDVAAADDSTLFVVSWSVDEAARLSPDGTLLATWGVGDGPSHILIDERTATSVADKLETEGLPTRFVLHQNFPNPVSRRPTAALNGDFGTRIVVELQTPATVNLTVYDRLGRRVAELYRGALSSGRHPFLFDATGLPAGIYFYRLTSGRFSLVRRMTVLP